MKYKSFKPLVCFKSTQSDQYYIIADGAWYKVDRFYSPEELNLLQEKISYSDKEFKGTPIKSYEVNGSNGKIYEVTYISNMWNCTCPAHSFKKYADCKHITQIKNTLK